MVRRIPAWVIIAGGWTVFGLYMSLQNHYIAAAAGRPEAWLLSLVRELLYSSIWAILTPAMLRFGRRFPLDRDRWARYGLLHLLLGAVVSLTQKALFGYAMEWYVTATDGSPFSWARPLRTLFSFFDYGILLYWIILLLQTGFRYYRQIQQSLLKSAQLEGQLAQAQLQSLKMQLQPHFLFNTLNAISVLVTKDPGKARGTITRLSELLRLTLEQGPSHEIPLATELRFLERYLSIEKTRFEDRLTVRLKVDKDATNAMVPAFLLQPLVENAIRHGVARRRGSTRVDISVVRRGEALDVAIRNDIAPDVQGVDTWKEGVGLGNTRARLFRLYGTRGTLRLRQENLRSVTVDITFPYREQTVAD